MSDALKNRLAARQFLERLYRSFTLAGHRNGRNLTLTYSNREATSRIELAIRDVEWGWISLACAGEISCDVESQWCVTKADSVESRHLKA